MRLDHAGVNVSDLEAAADWYCSAFAMEREFECVIEAVDLSIVMLRNAEHGHRIELLSRPGSAPGLRAANPAEAALTEGFGHLAFDVRDLDTEYARLRALGAAEVMDPRPSPEPDVRMAYLTDPEGNLIELVERDPLR